MLRTKLTGDTKAFTLVETMIAVGILTVVIVGITTMISNTQDSISITQTNSTRDKIALEIEKNMQKFANIEFSANNSSAIGNRKLRDCLYSGGGVCSVTNVNSQESFEFKIKASAASRILAGTIASPAEYDRMGVNNCRARNGSVDCPLWRAYAYFYATCAVIPPATTPAAQCDRANVIHLRYQVVPTRERLSKNTNDPRSNPLLLARPPEPEFSRNPDRYAISHKVGTVLTSASCPPNTEQVGWAGGGNIKCKCRFGLTQTGTDADGFPICPTTDRICGPNELLQGVNTSGAPICRSVRLQCGWITFGSDSSDGKCPNGGWLEAIDLGQCTAAPRSKKNAHRQITCARNRGKCCYYVPTH